VYGTYTHVIRDEGEMGHLGFGGTIDIRTVEIMEQD
jgi:hypothetical protein